MGIVQGKNWMMEGHFLHKENGRKLKI